MQHMVYVGSIALAHYFPEIKPKDADYILTYDAFDKMCKDMKDTIESCRPIADNKFVVRTKEYKGKSQICEFEIAWPGSTAEEFLKLCPEGSTIPPLPLLYALKMSHRYLKNSPHFRKTMKDIKLMRTKVGPGINLEYYDWFLKREKETYSYNHPALNVSKDTFFKDESFYQYDHDDIQEAVKIGYEPAYKAILSDSAEVKCDRSKFDNLEYYHKLYCALEECYVLALERYLIPNNGGDPRKAFDIAAMKVCTSITSGWFREWCWEHYQNIIDNYCDGYYHRFIQANADGKIREFKHES